MIGHSGGNDLFGGSVDWVHRCTKDLVIHSILRLNCKSFQVIPSNSLLQHLVRSLRLSNRPSQAPLRLQRVPTIKVSENTVGVATTVWEFPCILPVNVHSIVLVGVVIGGILIEVACAVHV